MNQYIPSTPEQNREILSLLGLDSLDALFDLIPADVRLDGPLNIPAGISEAELERITNRMSGKNLNTKEAACFLGAGAYDHYIPAAIDALLWREEFYTAYTPYQAEISQGTLQAIFEYQTMICRLTDMDIANASVYDGATALCEAALLACKSGGRSEVLISRAMHPENKEVLRTYAHFNGFTVTEYGMADGRADLADLEAKLSDNTAAVMLQSPNFFGIVEDLTPIADLAHAKKALFIVSCDPISLALLKSPGQAGADIAVGDGQSLGMPLSFGGPYLGFMAATGALMRKLPGRIAGQTTDKDGRRGFVLTLQTREQHIRREKATSNICSNQALNALTATIYLSLMGPNGLKEVAEQSLQKAHYAYDQLLATGKFTPLFSAPFFKEFALGYKGDITALNRKLKEKGIIGGYAVKEYPEIENGYLLAVTEKRTKAEIDLLVSACRE